MHKFSNKVGKYTKSKKFKFSMRGAGSKGRAFMFLRHSKFRFTKESLYILILFWSVTILVVFYKYHTGIEEQIHFQTQLMNAQNELISRTIQEEVGIAVADLAWYASDKPITNGILKDISDINEDTIASLLHHKSKYLSMTIFSRGGQVVSHIEGDNLLGQTENEHEHLTESEIENIVFNQEKRTVLVKLNPSGYVQLYTRTSDGHKYIHLDVELQHYQDLKAYTESQFGYHVGLTNTAGKLWKTIGDPNVEVCTSQSCEHDGPHVDGESMSGVIYHENSVVVWLSLFCHSELPYDVDEIVWINEEGDQENSVLAVSFLSGQALLDIYRGQINSMKTTVISLLLVELLLSMVMGAAYHNYKIAQIHLKRQATKDELTGALNRSAGFEILREMLVDSESGKSPFTVVYIDVDDLKSVNDAFGHDEGDKLIKVISESITKFVRTTDALIRIGGDEFVLVLPNCDREKANDILRRSLAWLAKYNEKKKYKWNANFSFGLAEYKHQVNMTAEDLINLADEQMYLHKISKQNSIKS